MRIGRALAGVHAIAVLVIACTPYAEAERPTDGGGPDAVTPPVDASSDAPTLLDASDASDANDGSVACVNPMVTKVANACGTLEGYVDMCTAPSLDGKKFFAFDPLKPKSNTPLRVFFAAEIGDGPLHLDVNGAYCAGPASASCRPGTCCPTFRSVVWSVPSIGLSAGTYPIRVLQYAPNTEPVPCSKPDATQVFDGSITLE